MIKGRKLISILLAVVLAVGLAMNAGATDIQNAKDKQETLEEQQNQAESEKKSLLQRVNEISASMKKIEGELDGKKEEIEEAEQELLMAQIEESEQYKDMKLRIQYMYENGNVDFIQIFLESESVADFLNKAEYITQLSEYDRDKLDEYQTIVKAVEEKELTLQAEYAELEKLQSSLIAQREEAEELLAEKKAELAGLASELAEVKNQIVQAEEAERKKREAEEARKAEEERQDTPDDKKEDTDSSSSSSTVVQKPVVSGNGYFTHPCPGMSYQSSYFGEVRYGIGDTRPHKGHDYAAPAGTPIYAAAAGTVMIAGYSYSAGYWVVINHGNGLVSKYMHMYRMPLVSAGDTVVKGQHIGGVGTTGQSTGNHLHFQVEVDGEAVNPSLYM